MNTPSWLSVDSTSLLPHDSSSPSRPHSAPHEAAAPQLSSSLLDFQDRPPLPPPTAELGGGHEHDQQLPPFQASPTRYDHYSSNSGRRGAPTSDLRGTLENLSSSPERNAVHLQQYDGLDDRRDSDPFPFSFSANSQLYAQRASFPIVSGETGYRRVIARLPGSSPQPGLVRENSELFSSGQHTPGLTDGSGSGSGCMSRSSSLAEPSHWYSPRISDSIQDVLADSPIIHDGSGYPFPEMYRSPSLGGVSPVPSFQNGGDEWRKRRASPTEDAALESPRAKLSNFTLRPSPALDAGRFSSPQQQHPRSFASASDALFSQMQSPRGGIYAELGDDDLRRSQHGHLDSPYSPVEPPLPMKQRRMSLADRTQSSPSAPFPRRDSFPSVVFGSSGRPPFESYSSERQVTTTPLTTSHQMFEHPPEHHRYSASHLDSPQTPRTHANRQGILGNDSAYASPYLDPATSPPQFPASPPPPTYTTSAAPMSHSRLDSYPGEDVSVIHRRPPPEDFAVPGADVRQQKLRFEEDHYTPLWIRYSGHQREGWCALCPGPKGKWLQLKNSAFWYHRQFQHGVSSVSGHYFLPPVETRPSENGTCIEGLCHSCGIWTPYQNSKGGVSSGGKGPTLWYRHSHQCHAYFSPKREATKQVRMMTQMINRGPKH